MTAAVVAGELTLGDDRESDADGAGQREHLRDVRRRLAAVLDIDDHRSVNDEDDHDQFGDRLLAAHTLARHGPREGDTFDRIRLFLTDTGLALQDKGGRTLEEWVKEDPPLLDMILSDGTGTRTSMLFYILAAITRIPVSLASLILAEILRTAMWRVHAGILHRLKMDHLLQVNVGWRHRFAQVARFLRELLLRRLCAGENFWQSRGPAPFQVQLDMRPAKEQHQWDRMYQMAMARYWMSLTAAERLNAGSKFTPTEMADVLHGLLMISLRSSGVELMPVEM
jgi:hypothetical protein